MKHLSRLVLALAGIAALAAIWSPFGSWWQFLATALLLLFVGTGLGSAADKPSSVVADHPEPIIRHGRPAHGTTSKENDQ